MSDIPPAADGSASGIAREAADVINGTRGAANGPRERSFQVIADYWTTYLRSRTSVDVETIRAQDVATMMSLLKIARASAGTPVRDHFVDQAGYAAIAGEIALAALAVADFARGVFERFDDKRVLLIGAGKMAHETLRYLREAGARDIVVLNRTAERAGKLAARLGGRPGTFAELAAELAAADLVVSTTGASASSPRLATRCWTAWPRGPRARCAGPG